MEGMNGGALKRTLRGRRGRRKALALIGLAVIVAAAALAAWFLESQRAGQGAAAAPAAAPVSQGAPILLIDRSAADIRSVDFKVRGSQPYTLVREARGGGGCVQRKRDALVFRRSGERGRHAGVPGAADRAGRGRPVAR